jgi:hypothetical protein
MRSFKLFHGYNDIGIIPVNGNAFERLMTMLHEVDAMAEPNRDNYEIPDDINDWDVTLSDGLGEE